MKNIKFNQVSKRWQESVAVEDISFDIPKGSFTVLLGPSGCGKSTTLRLLAGLESCSGGQILIDDEDVTQRTPSERNLSLVFQSYALFPHLTVAENILFGLKIRKVNKTEQAARLKRVSELLNLHPYLDRKPAQLSGGQQQRVALGRAIISERPICLMDEPLSNLDAKLRHEMRVEIRALQQKLGITMVYVTHDQVEAISMADQIVLLNNGRIEQIGSPSEIYSQPQTTFVARFIGTPPMNIIPLQQKGKSLAIAGSKQQVHELSGSMDIPLFLGIRPEDISIGKFGLKAQVLAFEFLGSDVLVDCQIGTEKITIRTDNQSSFATGETVFLSWKDRACHYFEQNSGRRIDLMPGVASQLLSSAYE
ncbi:ABC transporter ATP-binding protein [Sneathiella glossodoripedis]|uniref:ABC transporter ATP-binding protein n=1 Tax=Sneathiella glossodoripedis TaxID=418853 RepID=UPI000471C0A2|nr:ABC transporter ATP-binding protein [Sneathiella glossodoripedis]